MSKIIKKIVSMLLILSLVYANLAGTVFGIVSYAKDENNISAIKENEEQEEEINSLEIKTEEFYKNNMEEMETEYQEKLNLKLEYENKFNRVEIYDVKTEINNGLMEEEEISEEEIDEPEKINIFYKSTKINKSDLLDAIGKDGKLEIKYSQLLEEIKDSEITSDEEDTIIDEENNSEIESEEELSEENKFEEDEEIVEENNDDSKELEEDKEELNGVIIAENGTVEINAETEADEEGFITIIYPENTENVEINILTETDKIETLEIIHTKMVDKIANIEEANVLETIKQIIVKQDEEEILNKQEASNMSINYTKTVADLGMDKAQVSTSVDNKVNFTITMHTDGIKYDLYKNPYFVIEFPSEIETVNLDNILILNNRTFEIELVETATAENGNKIITVRLNGEQTEYTTSNEENVQIVLETTLRTNELTPSLNRKINLYYENENVKTYDGIGTQGFGKEDIDIALVANKEIIVETKAVVGEETVTSFKDNYSSVTVAPNTYNRAAIYGTIVNNMGEDISNAKILGTVTSIGPISGVQNVYYTANENATADINNVENGWTSEYIQNAKKYLIIAENFKQAENLNFAYYMYMPQVVEEDESYELKYDVMDSSNEILKTSKITINQEAPRYDIYEDEIIRANIVMDKEKAEVGEIVKATINITNISGKDLKNMKINIPLPKALSLAYRNVMSSDQSTQNIYINEKENTLDVLAINMENNTTITIEINAKIEKYETSSEKIQVNMSYEEREKQISNKVGIVKPSTIQTTITSNRLGKTLKAKEEIEYKVELKNNGESYANIDINVTKMPGISIQKIEAKNITTGVTKSATAVELDGKLSSIDIAPGEIVQITVLGRARELDSNTTNTFNIEIIGEDIDNTTTSKLTNNVSRIEKEIIVEENKADSSNEESNTNEKIENNTILGIAWIDKNNNGIKDKNEIVLKGVQAVLIDTKTSKEVAKITTNSEGEYEFKNVESGNYVVAFNYNTKTFAVTDYKNAEIEDEIDSDVISTTQDNKTVAKTEVLSVKEGKTENVNIGLVLNKTFDMSINKGITKVTVDNEQGTNTYDFNNTSIAKVEIDGKYLKGSMILVEYEIAVTNVGEIAGFAKVITDKIPEGMKFNSELNENWYEGENGTLYCEALENKELLPGETAIVKLILTKEMTDDKVTSPKNTVTLQETFNEYLIEDKKQDNNSSEATIIISLTTGKTESYVWLVLLVIAIIGMGTFGVIKITNKNSLKVTNKERRK